MFSAADCAETGRTTIHLSTRSGAIIKCEAQLETAPSPFSSESCQPLLLDLHTACYCVDHVAGPTTWPHTSGFGPGTQLPDSGTYQVCRHTSWVLVHLPLLTKLQTNFTLSMMQPSSSPTFCPGSSLRVFDSLWEARLHVAGDIRVADTGPLLAPITLAPVPGEQLILPSMIQWHAQASIHALKEPSTIVCMQLQRFLGNAGIMQRRLPVAPRLSMHCSPSSILQLRDHRSEPCTVPGCCDAAALRGTAHIGPLPNNHDWPAPVRKRPHVVNGGWMYT